METYVIAVAAVAHRGKYLIGKRAKTKKFAPGQWEFISGFIDQKGSAEKTILRELDEEVSLRGKIIRSGMPYVINDREARWIVLPFVVRSTSGKALRHSADHSELQWVKKNELKRYKNLRPFLKVL